MKICSINVRPLRFVCAMGLVIAMLGCLLFFSKSQTVYFGYTARLVPIYSVSTKEKKVALSFDAAWGCANTEELLNILDRYEARTTFFLVGFWAEKYPVPCRKRPALWWSAKMPAPRNARLGSWAFPRSPRMNSWK